MRRLSLRGIFRLAEAKRVSMSDPRGIVVDDDGLPLAIHVERFGPRLAKAVTRILHAAKGHVRTGAIRGPVDGHQPRPVPGDELLDAVAVERVNRARESVGRGVGELHRLLETRDTIETRHWPEQLLLRDG